MTKKFVYPLIAFVGVFVIHAAYSVWQIIEISKRWVQIRDITPLELYIAQQGYLLGFSYALAGAFTTYAFFNFLQNRKGGVAGIIGGATLAGFLYFAGCFLLGCCGSPMLAVYLALFGSSFLGFTRPLTAIITLISVVIGYFWIARKTKLITCCVDGDSCNENIKNRKASTTMKEVAEKNKQALTKIRSGLSEGMKLRKCQKCGCMKETLESLQSALPTLQMKNLLGLSSEIEVWLNQMQPIKYACLGCKYCIPAVAMNIYNETFSTLAKLKQRDCGFEIKEEIWPPVAGEYFAFCDGEECPVAVSTLSDVGLVERLAKIKPKELCIVGKTETENIGIDKIIKNTITNSTIRFLVVAGKEPAGHLSGNTLLALSKNGVDANMRVIGSAGRRPVLKNVTHDEIEAFRKQVQLIDMIGCDDETRIVGKLKELAQQRKKSCGCAESADETTSVQISNVVVVQAKEPSKKEMDKAGYFVILPQPEKKTITVEHYSYDNTLLRIIEGQDARSIYWTIIENKWVTQLSHAAYLGKELEKAELSIELGSKYVQDGA